MLLHGLLALVLIAVATQEQDPNRPVVVVGEAILPTANIQTRPSPLPKKKQKPVVQLICPRTAISRIFQPAVISATIRVNYPGEGLWCPGVEWYIGSDLKGGHESDCPTYETVLAEKGEPDRWSEDMPRYFSLWQGDYVIVAKLTRSGKVLARAECRVTVR